MKYGLLIQLKAKRGNESLHAQLKYFFQADTEFSNLYA